MSDMKQSFLQALANAQCQNYGLNAQAQAGLLSQQAQAYQGQSIAQTLNGLSGPCAQNDHRFIIGDADNIRCQNCGVACSGENLAALGFMMRSQAKAYDAKRNALADECGRLRDENLHLLAENARLRRRK